MISGKGVFLEFEILYVGYYFLNLEINFLGKYCAIHFWREVVMLITYKLICRFLTMQSNRKRRLNIPIFYRLPLPLRGYIIDKNSPKLELNRKTVLETNLWKATRYDLSDYCHFV